MYYASKFCFGIRVVLLGSTILLSCNNPHAPWIDEQENIKLVEAIHQYRVIALPRAVRRGDVGFIKTLLNLIPGADRVAFINHRDNAGDTALDIAIQEGREAVVNTLLNRGADINQRNNNEETALHMAERRGDEMLVNTLLDRGTDNNQRNNNEETALHMAVRRGDAMLVNTLLDSGTDIHQRNNTGETALLIAVRSRHVGVTGTLLARLLRGGEEMPEYMLQYVHSAGMRNLLETLLKNTRLDPFVSDAVAEALMTIY